jgi:hypothetical protein
MSEFSIGSLLKDAQAAKPEKSMPDFREKLQASFTGFLEQAVAITRPLRTEVQKGAGVLGSSAKREIARRVIRHEPTNADQLRTARVKREGEPARAPDTVTVHVVDLVDPASLLTKSPDKFSATLGWLTTLVGKEDLTFHAAESTMPRIEVGKVRAVMHLLEQNVFGQFEMRTCEVNTPSDLKKVRDLYAETQLRVTQRNPTGVTSTQQMAYLTFGTGLAEEIRETDDEKTVNVPVYLNPRLNREQGNYIGSYGELVDADGVTL